MPALTVDIDKIPTFSHVVDNGFFQIELRRLDRASAAAMARYVREYCETEPRTGPEAVLTGVPGVPEPPDALSEPGDLDGLGGVAGEDFDEEAVTELFIHVASLWEVLGASDAQQRLTPLGWWGLPEAMRKVWAPSS